MKTQCPNCGAELEFRYDDSFVRICSYCRTAVARTDRGVDSLGQVADLTPIESPLRLFAEGHFGSTSFLLVGMAQIRHEAGGIWQEWYAKFDGGRWGWLAEAQGRYYLTFEEPWTAPPSIAQLGPGATIDLPVRGQPHPCTVSEITTASYIAATGELPFRLVPNGPFRYADLSDGRGTFATIDFGGPGDPPSLYLGAQVPLADLKITGGEVAPPQDKPIASKRLACPSCNAPLELHAPGETQRVVCPSCNQLVDTSSGVLQLLGPLSSKANPTIRPGTKGTFSEGEMTVIGFVRCCASVDGDWWPFDEYLLHAPKIGFRWLVESDGHWSYVQPIAAGAVEATAKGYVYDGVKFLPYQTAPLRVDQVLGEFYWQIAHGETVDSEDLIAPPAMLSRESTKTEENWSLSTYMTVREVQHAFGNKELPLGTPDGIAPNQVDAWKAASGVMSIAFLVLLVVGMIFAMAAKDTKVYAHDVPIGGAPPVAAAPSIDPLAGVIATPPGAVPPECVDYKTVVDAIAACTSLPQSTREALADVYRVTTTGESSSEALAAVCKAGADSIRQALASQCKLPDPAGAAGSGSGSAESGAGSGSAAGPIPDLPVNAFFSDPIQIDGGHNIEIEVSCSSINTNWVGITADLVEEATGTDTSVDANIEYYSGIDDGDSWSEGSRETTEVIGPQPAGSYILRVEGQYGGSGEIPVSIVIKQGVFRGRWLAWAMLILGLPLLLVGAVSYSHEKKRWENSNAGKAPITGVTILVMSIGGVFVAIVFLIKAMASSSSSDD